MRWNEIFEKNFTKPGICNNLDRYEGRKRNNDKINGCQKVQL